MKQRTGKGGGRITDFEKKTRRVSEQMGLKEGLKKEWKCDWWMRIGKQFRLEVESTFADMNVTLMDRI